MPGSGKSKAEYANLQNNEEAQQDLLDRELSGKWDPSKYDSLMEWDNYEDSVWPNAKRGETRQSDDKADDKSDGNAGKSSGKSN